MLVLTQEQHTMLQSYFTGIRSKPTVAGGKVTYRLTAEEFQLFQANQQGGGGAVQQSAGT